jgi:hypothetical protein
VHLRLVLQLCYNPINAKELSLPSCFFLYQL